MHSSFFSIGCGFFLAAVCENTIGVGLVPLLTLLDVLDIVLVGCLLDMLLGREVGVAGPSDPADALDIVLDSVLLEALVGAVAASGGSHGPGLSLLLWDPKPPLRKSATELLRRLAVRENEDGVGVWLRLLALLNRNEGRRR